VIDRSRPPRRRLTRRQAFQVAILTIRFIAPISMLPPAGLRAARDAGRIRRRREGCRRPDAAFRCPNEAIGFPAHGTTVGTNLIIERSPQPSRTAATPWMERPPPLITNMFSITPPEVPGGTPGALRLISWLPVQSGLTA
jgi:hypothetical protein